jgi:hypothetical protein
MNGERPYRPRINLEIRDNSSKSRYIAIIGNNGAIQTLLALALLLEQVTATTALKGKLTGSCALKTLFAAAVGLNLWHKKG